MSQGIVIFGFNNHIVDYRAMAEWSAKRIRNFLNLPTTLITDRPYESSVFDQVITIDPESGNTKYYHEFETSAEWYNRNRYSVFRLSPYDSTLVLDADYVVNSSQLTILFQHNREFCCHHTSVDISFSQEFSSSNRFGLWNTPMSWATVLYFRKTKLAEYVFYIMSMVKDHWHHYRNLYGISNPVYRNDHALSIALRVLNCSRTESHIPWNLLSVLPEHHIQQLDIDKWKISYVSQDKSRYMYLQGQDFHALGKAQLGEIIAKQQ